MSASHKMREESGKDSTKHIASTMQGTATAISDKILRKADVELAGAIPNISEKLDMAYWIDRVASSDTQFGDFISDKLNYNDIIDKIEIIDPLDFRNKVRSTISNGEVWLHEGSQ